MPGRQGTKCNWPSKLQTDEQNKENHLKVKTFFSCLRSGKKKTTKTEFTYIHCKQSGKWYQCSIRSLHLTMKAKIIHALRVVFNETCFCILDNSEVIHQNKCEFSPVRTRFSLSFLFRVNYINLNDNIKIFTVWDLVQHFKITSAAYFLSVCMRLLLNVQFKYELTRCKKWQIGI